MQCVPGTLLDTASSAAQLAELSVMSGSVPRSTQFDCMQSNTSFTSCTNAPKYMMGCLDDRTRLFSNLLSVHVKRHTWTPRHTRAPAVCHRRSECPPAESRLPQQSRPTCTCTERQWIFWCRVGVRFCASQLNSQSWLSCRVESVHLDSRGSSGSTCALLQQSEEPVLDKMQLPR